MSTTKLDAEGLAAKHIPDWSVNDFTNKRIGFVMGVETVAQPLADELAEVKAERDELLAELKEQARLLGAGGSREARLMAERDELRKALDMMGVGWVTFNALVLSDTPKIEDILEAGRLFARALDTWNTILAKYPKP